MSNTITGVPHFSNPFLTYSSQQSLQHQLGVVADLACLCIHPHPHAQHSCCVHPFPHSCLSHTCRSPSPMHLHPSMHCKATIKHPYACAMARHLCMRKSKGRKCVTSRSGLGEMAQIHRAENEWVMKKPRVESTKYDYGLPPPRAHSQCSSSSPCSPLHRACQPIAFACKCCALPSPFPPCTHFCWCPSTCAVARHLRSTKISRN